MHQLEGRRPVLEALRAGQPINKIVVAKGDRRGGIHSIIQSAREQKVVVQEVERSVLDSMSDTQAHQGVIAYLAAVTYVDLEDLLDKQYEHPLFLLVLDGIQDPHNLGSLIRTADCAGVHGVIIPRRRAVGVTPVVAKAAAGAVSHVPVCRVTNVNATIERIKECGCWIVGADMQGGSCYQQDLTGPVALVVGGEGKGLARSTREACDYVVSMPMYGQVESLNAGVAGALLMYEIVRQRHQKNA